MSGPITEAARGKESKAFAGLTSGLAIAVLGAALAQAADLYRAFGLQFYPQQYMAGILALSVPLTLLVYDFNGERRRGSPPWYDVVAAAFGFATAAYAAVRYPVLSELIFKLPMQGLIPGTILTLLVIEALRRATGRVLTGVVLLAIGLALVGHHLPKTLAGRPTDIDYLFYYLAFDPTAMLGTPLLIVSTVVVAFVFFGQILLAAGGSDFFTEASMVVVGRFRGGQAKIAVTASCIFGTISGSVVSNVATTGVITIPLMRDAGYTPEQAGAIEAVASTGGQLMPPIMGAAAFLMAEFLQIQYTDVVLAALIPAVLYYLALFILADLEAARRNIQRVDPKLIPRAIAVAKAGWYFPLPFVVLIGGLFSLHYTPEYAALLAAATVVICGVLFGYKGKRVSAMELFRAVRDAGFAVLDILAIGAAAGMVIGVLSITGLDFALTLSLVQLGGGSVVGLLIVAAVICILLGMGMPTTGVYILLAALVAPSLVKVGIQPIAAHMFILYFGMMSMITPPVAIAAFAAASLAGADPVRTGFEAMRFGWLAYLIPFLFVASPSLLMQASPGVVILAALSAAFGVWLVCIGIMGYLRRALGAAMRLLFCGSGLALLIPAGAFEGALATDIVGGALGVGLLLREFLARRVRDPQQAVAAGTPAASGK